MKPKTFYIAVSLALLLGVFSSAQAKVNGSLNSQPTSSVDIEPTSSCPNEKIKDLLPLRAKNTKEKHRRRLFDAPIASASIGLLILLGYYLVVWFFVGRNPKEKIIFRHTPPEGISPAGVRYLTKMKFDAVCMTATILGIVVKGRADLAKRKGEFKLKQQGENNHSLPLFDDETKAYASLFGIMSEVVLGEEDIVIVSDARKQTKRVLKGMYKKGNFQSNTIFSVLGMGLAGFFFVKAMLQIDFPLILLFCIGLPAWSFVVAELLRWALKKWQKVLLKKSSFAIDTFVAGLSTLISILCLCVEGVLLFKLIQIGGGWLAGAVVLMGVTPLGFVRGLRHRTASGRKLMAEISGFKKYLSGNDGDGMEPEALPERNIGLFARYLPYAAALGVEQQWATQFEGLLRRRRGNATVKCVGLPSSFWAADKIKNAVACLSFELSHVFHGTVIDWDDISDCED